MHRMVEKKEGQSEEAGYHLAGECVGWWEVQFSDEEGAVTRIGACFPRTFDATGSCHAYIAPPLVATEVEHTFHTKNRARYVLPP